MSRSSSACASFAADDSRGRFHRSEREGTAAETEACLLNKNRNPNLTQKEIEAYCATTWARSKFSGLAEGIVGDDTEAISTT